jgi:putative polymerase
MSAVGTPANAANYRHVPAWLTSQGMAAIIVFAACSFNFVLCFINTRVFAIGGKVVVAAEVALIGAALGLIWRRGWMWYASLLVLSAYFFAVMLIRSEFDPKILRDFLIPIVFFFLGSYLGVLGAADRLVTLLILTALGAALFEWLALDSFLHYFDVIHYYLARGTDQSIEADSAAGLFIRGTDSSAGLFINATRFEPRTLLPLLGQHRVSGIFLEPVSVGNFAAIAFAWVLLRDRGQSLSLLAKTVAIAAILVLADARFGCYLCALTLIIYFIVPMVRPSMLMVLPFVVVVAIVIYGEVNWNEPWDNTIAGRLLSTANSLLDLGPWQMLGFKPSEAFATGYAGDSGYGYALVKVGVIGLAAIWAIFVYAPVQDADAWRFRNFIAVYVVSLLTISASLFSIKTAALLWFLYGTLNNPYRSVTSSATMPAAAVVERS